MPDSRPPMDLVSIPENPVPAGAVAGRLRTSDGVSLRFVKIPPPEGRKGTVCVFQGRAEFIEKYFEVAGELRARGFAVAMLDWRGQGLSDRALRDRRKGHVEDFAEYDRDLDVFMREVVLPDCPPPYFALAHSMGATILLRAAEQNRRWFNRTVLSAPMLGLPGRRGQWMAQATARWLRRLGSGRAYVPFRNAPGVASLPFEGNPLTSDPLRYARSARIVEANPDLALGAPTIAWLAAAYDQMSAFDDPACPLRMRHPMLIVAAGRDLVVSNAPIERFASHLRVGAYVMVPGALHEILMERDIFRSQFWATFDAFVPGSAEG
jgi:lysophospholipase